MKIDAINTLSQLKSINLAKRIQPNFRSKTMTTLVDTFEKSTSLIEKNALAKLKKVNLSEYKTLSDIEKNTLRKTIKNLAISKTINQNFNWDLDLHQYASECIKQALDTEYGAGNYVVVTIGRSLSSIGKFLGFKIGEDNVKNIPLSDLSNIETTGTAPIEEFVMKNDVNSYKSFLDSEGLSKKDIEISGKKYIILDYAYTGNSIKNAYKILTSDSFWGNKNKNVTFSTIQDFFPEKAYSNKSADLLAALAFSKFKTYSFVERLNNSENFSDRQANNEKIELLKEKKYIKKLFAFNMLDAYYGKNKQLKDYVINYEAESSYPNQKKQKWLSPSRQFNKDVFIDIYELDKAILRISDNALIDNMKTLRWQLKNSSPYEYYSDLKSEVDKILKTGI